MTRLRMGVLLLGVLVMSAAVGPWLLPFDPLDPDYLHRYAGPSAEHWLGTDSLGRDVLARSVAGGRVSLTIALAATVLTVLLGGAVGVAAAGIGGRLEMVLVRVFDAVLAFPGFLLVLLLVAMFGGGVTQTIIALTLAGSALYFRLARGYTRKQMQMDYILAGAALGASRARLLMRYATPNFMGNIAVQAASTAATFLLVEASLSYLGLGVPLPTPSWGNVLQDARAMLTRQPWAAVAPGVFLLLAALALQLMSDGARDRYDRRGR